jgi:hypothetical protein
VPFVSSILGALLGLAFISFFTIGIPTHTLGERLGVPHPSVALIPFIGPLIVLLRGVGSSPWLAAVPVVGPLVVLLGATIGSPFIVLPTLVWTFGFSVWLAVAIPLRHNRSWWWILWFLAPTLNIIGFWVYAYTLEPRDTYSATWQTRIPV